MRLRQFMAFRVAVKSPSETSGNMACKRSTAARSLEYGSVPQKLDTQDATICAAVRTRVSTSRLYNSSGRYTRPSDP